MSRPTITIEVSDEKGMETRERELLWALLASNGVAVVDCYRVVLVRDSVYAWLYETNDAGSRFLNEAGTGAEFRLERFDRGAAL